jgi:SAM-dependent methyltransferase
LKKNNLDINTVKSFGSEWSRFPQDKLSEAEAKKIFESYFNVFPLSDLSRDSVGFDVGCGTGRWAKLLLPRVGHLNCVDPSEALEVAKSNLSGFENVSFFKESVDSISLEENSHDFGYSLGVLHHVPDTEAAIRSCVKLLKPGAPLLLYLYYDLEGRGVFFTSLWKLSNLFRVMISRMPNFLKMFVWLGFSGKSLPLSFYSDKSFYTIRTDSRDRFGTPLEKRFNQSEIILMMKNSNLTKIKFSPLEPYWCVVGYKEESIN